MVFVLSTGRCGSLTFAKACEHITNYTVGHESRAHMIGPERLNYPDNHIEVDNRLCWFLGQLPEDAFYVHLTRDPEEVARSYSRRWHKGGIMEAFARGITARADIADLDSMEIARWYVETVSSNIVNFIEKNGKWGKWTGVRLAEVQEHFSAFWYYTGAEGDLDAALAEFDVRHNAS
jgi:hypothetical protein